MTQAPATPELVERLRSPAAEQGDPKAVYRTRPVALFEEAADALEAQQARIAELEAAVRKVALFRDPGEDPVAYFELVLKAHAENELLLRMEASQALADRYEKALREVRARTYSSDRGCALKAEPVAEICDLVSQALSSSQGRHEGGEDGLQESPCGVGPSDLTDPQTEHSDGEGA